MATSTPRTPLAPSIPLVVMTDLDGTLLDHHSYSAAPAYQALAQLKERNIPVIFNTSKTRDEVLGLRQALDNHEPFVCENGSAVFVPKPDNTGYNPEILGASYQEILKVLHQLQKKGYRFRGFNDMPATEVAALTGLSIDDAHLAKQRAASEPLVWTDTDDARSAFIEALRAHGLQATQGGRFLHVMGNTDKSNGVDFFRQYYHHHWGVPQHGNNRLRIAALGDGENDRQMLEAADYPIVIPGAKSTLTLASPHAVTADAAGPKGWNTCLLALLDQLITEFNCG